MQLIDAVNMVLEMTGQKAEIGFMLDMPTGPINRVVYNALAKELLGWEPSLSFKVGLRETINWYYATKDRQEIQQVINQGGFIARKMQTALDS